MAKLIKSFLPIRKVVHQIKLNRRVKRKRVKIFGGKILYFLKLQLAISVASFLIITTVLIIGDITLVDRPLIKYAVCIIVMVLSAVGIVIIDDDNNKNINDE